MSDSVQIFYPGDFLAALADVFRDEGGLSNDPADPGGLTKFGISQRSYPQLDIKTLTRDQAAAIYFRDWWTAFGFDKLPPGIGGKVFNLAVNMGAVEAVRCLQFALRACGAPAAIVPDGELGMLTLDAAHTAEMGVKVLSPTTPSPLMAAIRSEAASHYRVLIALDSKRQQFAANWMARAYE